MLHSHWPIELRTFRNRPNFKFQIPPVSLRIQISDQSELSPPILLPPPYHTLRALLRLLDIAAAPKPPKVFLALCSTVRNPPYLSPISPSKPAAPKPYLHHFYRFTQFQFSHLHFTSPPFLFDLLYNILQSLKHSHFSPNPAFPLP